MVLVYSNGGTANTMDPFQMFPEGQSQLHHDQTQDYNYYESA